MDSFTISLAEIPIGIQPVSPETRAFFTEYLSDQRPCFTVMAEEKDLEYARLLYYRRNGHDSSFYPLPTQKLERMALLRLIANRIPDYNAILFHGSAIAVNGKAYLFAARSGTGKTTHTNLWLQQLPQAHMLNGDKPFLKLTEKGRTLVCGTPWRGKEAVGYNEMLPLEAICFLERAKENHVLRITPQEAGKLLIRQIYLPEGAAGVRAIQLMNRISETARLFRLGCNMEPEAAQVSIRAMIPEITEDGTF